MLEVHGKSVRDKNALSITTQINDRWAERLLQDHAESFHGFVPMWIVENFSATTVVLIMTAATIIYYALKIWLLLLLIKFVEKKCLWLPWWIKETFKFLVNPFTPLIRIIIKIIFSTKFSKLSYKLN